jgi:hypothetical protein
MSTTLLSGLASGHPLIAGVTITRHQMAFTVGREHTINALSFAAHRAVFSVRQQGHAGLGQEHDGVFKTIAGSQQFSAGCLHAGFRQGCLLPHIATDRVAGQLRGCARHLAVNLCQDRTRCHVRGITLQSRDQQISRND